MFYGFMGLISWEYMSKNGKEKQNLTLFNARSSKGIA